MEHTSNYNLSQWAGEDRILREDFNADNTKIEAALAQEVAARAAADTNLEASFNAGLAALNIQHVITGSYTGDNSSNRFIPLPFTPKFVILMGYNSSTSLLTVATSDTTRYVASNGCGSSPYVRIVENGLQLSTDDDPRWHNTSGKTEVYIAVQ